MKNQGVPFHIDRKGFHITFDSVPAWVCQQCGQAMFEESETRDIESVIEAVEKKAKNLAKAA
ncbi:MAG: YgiT-type zinc finger protein [Candidatus Riflebacteria bacterium]|nr:YgiT-type zinc finger protein [Candidatus Riflebacteria bacterium]